MSRDASCITNRTIALLSKMMNLAEAWGYRPCRANPCRHVNGAANKRKRDLTDDELSRLRTLLASPKNEAPQQPCWRCACYYSQACA